MIKDMGSWSSRKAGRSRICGGRENDLDDGSKNASMNIVLMLTDIRNALIIIER